MHPLASVALLFMQQVNATLRVGPKSWIFAKNPSAITLKCDKTALSIGEFSTCDITLDATAPPPGLLVIPYDISSPDFILNPPSLTIPDGQSTGNFTVTRVK